MNTLVQSLSDNNCLEISSIQIRDFRVIHKSDSSIEIPEMRLGENLVRAFYFKKGNQES